MSEAVKFFMAGQDNRFFLARKLLRNIFQEIFDFADVGEVDFLHGAI